ncbi:MAG: MarR family transcriptional regulator [Parvibaculum sp.]|jgi:DNA-binding MarR family transcriptional regulator|uniref:MarR family winged helix-turn-helix transcriptional regulator n=1 Tax=Parvibaculum sp. TaxID=2024848 RepID=UPI0028522F2D|nr:MarR family transcriptional regulator [Parvibaculum sp.]MDR3497994.1 MarR family transcriptional regulator [Parvibaculum sp.]
MTEPFYRPDTYKAKSAISYLVRRSHNLLTPKLEALFERQGFTFSQWAVLMHLRDGLADTAADIARSFHHDGGAMTRIIDQLEARNLIERKRCCEDRRVVRLKLTPEGARTVETLIPLVADFLNQVVADFTREEAEQLLRLMTKLIAGLESLDKPTA